MTKIFSYTKQLLLFSQFILCAAITSAQTNGFRFNHYNSDQGLSQSVIRKIIQTQNGFLWVATEDGPEWFKKYFGTDSTNAGNVAGAVPAGRRNRN